MQRLGGQARATAGGQTGDRNPSRTEPDTANSPAPAAPCRYHTALCSNGAHCRRKRCFFAHAVHELRPLKLRSAGGAGPAPAAVAGQPAASARRSIDVSDQVQQASRLWAPRPFQQLPSSTDAAAAWAGALPESAGSDAPALAAIRVPAAAGAFVQVRRGLPAGRAACKVTCRVGDAHASRVLRVTLTRFCYAWSLVQPSA